MADSTKSKAAWYAAYPVARTQSPAAIDRAQVLQLIKKSTGGPQSYVLVDLRRTDHEASISFSLIAPYGANVKPRGEQFEGP